MNPSGNSLRSRREALGLGPSELARRAGMTRQALHRIEAGDHSPGVLAALHLARALDCRVEDLFHLPDAELEAALVGQAAVGQRLHLAHVGDTLRAYPLSGVEALSGSADALLTATLPEGRAHFAPLTPAQGWEQTAVLCGCDPALSLLRGHAAPARVLLRPAVSETALAALVSGEAHAAGLHLYDPVSSESNLPFVAAALPDEVVHVYALWSWEQGLTVPPGNPQQLASIADLGRAGLRIANRPPGSGSRRLLDHWLAQVGLDASQLSGYPDEYASPLDLAGAVAHGQADVGVGPRSAAQAHGLAFVPLLRERFDLVIPDRHLKHPGVQALLQAARSPTLHAELRALGGYDPAESGQPIATFSPSPPRSA
ncbi:hypothetical protein GCM10022631_38580 [Deinococcus rubellus]|uniref:substrate-binding domain-containing protein n=1 Tax=Deinococcus rubellus TaxID=1889240 RepID=UPI0031E6BB09